MSIPRFPQPVQSRRQFLGQSLAASAAGMLVLGSGSSRAADNASGAIEIGSRRELFLDDVLIERLDGQAARQLHHPQPKALALVHDAPWEGTGSGYHSVFRDGDKYRMYYKAWHLDAQQGKLNTAAHPLLCCYAESDDGIEWEKPNLQLVEFDGSKANNIVINSGTATGPGGGTLNVDAGHPAIFKDENPAASEDAKYKAILRSSSPNGLLPFKSPDGLHWSPMSDEPILRGLGAFDSQNLAFWDPTIGKYRAYWRIFTEGKTTDAEWKPAGHRAIRSATSDDLLQWSKPIDLTYADSPSEQLYTNQIKPYHRAPHLLIGFPTRYIDRGWSDSMEALPELEHRKLRASSTPRYGTAITEGLLMSSRDGTHFHRWNEAFLPPGPQRPGSWNYGHQYIAWHLVETQSSLPGADNELSLYAGESYWTGKGSALRRYTLRLDGFASIRGSMQGGEVVTKPLTFSGDKLQLNFATSAAGGVRVELQDPGGTSLKGFSLEDCPEVFGDATARTVAWKNGNDVSSLNGRPIRLRFALKDADLYAFQFVDG